MQGDTLIATINYSKLSIIKHNYVHNLLFLENLGSLLRQGQ